MTYTNIMANRLAILGLSMVFFVTSVFRIEK